MLLDLPPPPPAPPGPVVPLVRSLPRASAVGSWSPCGIEAFTGDLASAVVVVEDEALTIQALPSLRAFLEVRMRLMAAGLPFPQVLGGPLPEWTDPTVIRAGGNVVHKVYGLGALRF